LILALNDTLSTSLRPDTKEALTLTELNTQLFDQENSSFS